MQQQEQLFKESANLPAKMTSINDMIALNKQLEALNKLKRQKMEEGMRQKQKNDQIITDMKAQLEEIKEQLKRRNDQEAVASDLTAEKTLAKDLVLWRRKLDEMRNKTTTKRAQF